MAHPPGSGRFQSSVPFHVEHPSALAVYCSDGRFTESVEDLLRSLGHERLDTITLPGGPGLLHPYGALLIDHEAVANASRFLIAGHGITHAVLIAHGNCGYYRQRFTGESPERIELRQREDLKSARDFLLGGHRALKVDLYYATVGQHVRFDPVR